MVKHGGNVWAIERKSHHRFDRFLDFSSNINPLGPPPRVREAVLNGIKKLSCYPDPEYIRLRKGVSNFLGVNLSSVFVGNGLSQIIDLVSRSCNFKEAVIVNPTYSEYEQACLKAKIPVTNFAMKEKDNFTLNEEIFYKTLRTKKEAVIFLCNPNNPTGTFIQRPFFERLLKKVSSKRQWLIVDEAFIDFTSYGRKDSLIHLINTYPRLVVLWSLTKIFSIPGLRIGAAIANNKIIERLHTIAPPWSVNILAEEATMASLKDKTFLKKTSCWIKKEKKYLSNSLKKFDNLKVYPSEAPFFLIKILNKRISARALSNKLLSHKILIRDCSNFHHLDRFFFRIAIKDRTSNRRLISLLARYIK